METTHLSYYADIISAILAAASMLIPVIYTRMKQRVNLDNYQHYIASLNTRKQLQDLLNNCNKRHDPHVFEKLTESLENIENDILAASYSTISVRPFYIVLFIEVLILVVIWTSGSSAVLNTVFEGNSQESGIGFFEGVFQTPAMRWLVTILNVIAAAALTNLVVKRVIHLFENKYLVNLIGILIFHVVIVVLGFATYYLLSWVDDYFSWF